jgi:hypothetical protein
MGNVRQERWKRFLAVYGRLPLWLQGVLLPWLFPAQFLSLFPILTLALCAVAASFLAYLKRGYLEEQLTWGAIGWLATSPLWLFVAFGYLLLVWVAIGTVPLAIFVFFRQWREKRPFSLQEPVPDIPEETRLRLREAKPLTRDDLRVILAIDEANTMRLRPVLMICAGSFAAAFIGITAAWKLLGYYNEGVNGFVFLLCFSTLSPVLFLFHPTPRLRCRHCGHSIVGKGLKRAAETNACPKCSGSETLATEAPRPDGGPLWDSEVA